MLDNNGQTVNLYPILEINLNVDLVGHSELLKHFLIDFVLYQVKLIKPEFQLKIYYLVVYSHVVKDATVVLLLLLGVGLKE